MAGTNEVLGGGGFHRVAMRVRDFDASLAFYRDLLGMKPLLSWGSGDKRAAMLDSGDGSCVELFAGGAGQAGEGAWMHLALRTTRVDEVCQAVRQAGMTVTVEPKDVDIPSQPQTTKVRLCFFKGPDGEIVELFQLRQ